MIERKEYLEDLVHFKDKNIVKIVTGIRRCGKSTLLEMYREYLINQGTEKEQIVSVNLEDGDFRTLRGADALYDYVCSMLHKDKMNYVFLDEVQQVSDFQKAVDWLYVKRNVDLYITGSNAFLLSGELATLLSGGKSAYLQSKVISERCGRVLLYIRQTGTI